MSSNAELRIRPASDLLPWTARPRTIVLTAGAADAGAGALRDHANDRPGRSPFSADARPRRPRTGARIRRRDQRRDPGREVSMVAPARRELDPRISANDPLNGSVTTLMSDPDWTLQMLLRDLHDAQAALDAWLGAGDDHDFLREHRPAVDRIGRHEPVLLTWDTTEPVGREALVAHEGWPLGWRRHLALLTAFRRAATRGVHASGRGLTPLGTRLVDTLEEALPVRASRQWLMTVRHLPH